MYSAERGTGLFSSPRPLKNKNFSACFPFAALSIALYIAPCVNYLFVFEDTSLRDGRFCIVRFFAFDKRLFFEYIFLIYSRKSDG